MVENGSSGTPIRTLVIAKESLQKKTPIRTLVIAKESLQKKEVTKK